MNKYQKQKARAEAIRRLKERDDCFAVYEAMGFEKALLEIYRGGEFDEERKESDKHKY